MTERWPCGHNPGVSLSIRPSFAVELQRPSPQVIEELAAALATGSFPLRRARVPGGGDSGRRDRDHLTLTVEPSEQRLWSPWLAIDVTANDGGTLIFARFSPHPSVWTGFAFAYLTLGVILLFSLMFAGAQAMTGAVLWPLLVSAGAACALGALWAVTQIGIRLARGQMEALHAALDRAINSVSSA